MLKTSLTARLQLIKTIMIADGQKRQNDAAFAWGKMAKKLRSKTNAAIKVVPYVPYAIPDFWTQQKMTEP